jgi:hypothetical protein
MTPEEQRKHGMAYHIVTEIMRILDQAIENRQEFTFDIEVGNVPDPVEDVGIARNPVGRGLEIHISVKPRPWPADWGVRPNPG